MKEILLADIEWIQQKVITLLKKNNIHTVEDLLFDFPTKFDDYTITSYDNVLPETLVTIEGVVQSKATINNIKTSLSVMNFFAEIDGVRIKVVIFNRHFLRTKISYGSYVRLTGKFNDKKTNFTASEISFSEFNNQINPVFNIKGITDEKMLDLKAKVYEEYCDEIVDNLPQDILTRHNLIGLKRAIKYINIPEDIEEVRLAIKRIKFEELFLYQLKVKYMFYMRKNFPQGIAIDYDTEKVNIFIKKLPFKLTDDQVSAVDVSLKDINSSYKMNRLLQGEVGSGKTVVAAILLYAVTTRGYQGAIMVPTEVLAKQHYLTFTEQFKEIGLNICMLTSSISSKERKDILDNLENGNIDIVIGTHSLFQKDVIFNKLGLVVTDEEHRFGVKQRVSIVGKGYLIDHLKMSATPIPRTLAISVLGDSDISIIKTLPGNKKEVITEYISYSYKDKVFIHMREELDRGRQIYIITPMIDESDVMDLNNAKKVYENTKKYFAGICEVGLIHSKLKNEEKEEVMMQFASNRVQILVSTSVIEVGINVVNATTMIILDADRFGIAQLHQMRGRVRRSDYQAFCFLISDTTSAPSINRLKLVAENSDGFVLAEEDLLIRGPGDFFSEKQSGAVIFKMADIVLDKEILELANNEADRVIKEEKLFKDDIYKRILEIVHDNYQNKKELLN